MLTQKCKQCGELKPLDGFRVYYNNRKGHYKVCKVCERINSRAKYLNSKSSLRFEESDELSAINDLYDLQRSRGLHPPAQRIKQEDKVMNEVDRLTKLYNDNWTAGVPEGTPEELSRWLSCALDNKPAYYTDDVYEALKAKYRPIVSIDPKKLVPVYDDTYKEVLEKILDRFNVYEDNYELV